jgi:hypothetical protein
MLIDHARAGMTHLANDPFFRDTGGEQLADEGVPCSVRPAIAHLGFFEMRTPKVISYRPVRFVWPLRVAV